MLRYPQSTSETGHAEQRRAKITHFSFTSLTDAS
jgi:hypothetical protein